MPVSLVGTFMLFPLLGFSINTLSLFGLVLAIGLVVDDAIVVVEAVEHHIEKGLSPNDATLKAMEEVSGPVIGIALILVGGVRADRVHPRHHRTALPAVRGDHRGLGDPLGVQRAHAQPGAGGAAAAAEERRARGPLGAFFAGSTAFRRATDGYVRCLRRADSQERGLAMLLPGRLLACGAALLRVDGCPSSFLPDEDQGYFYMNVQLPDAASLQRTDAVASRSKRCCRRRPGVQYVPRRSSGFSLLSAVSTTYNGFFFVTLEAWDERNSRMSNAAIVSARLNAGAGEAARGAWRSPSRRRRFPASAPRAASRSCWRTAPAGRRVPRRQH